MKVALIFDDVLRPDTTGVYCLRAMRGICDVRHFRPTQIEQIPRGTFDLHLYIDDGLDYPLPADLGPSAMWAIDTHLNPERLIRRCTTVSFVFAAQRDGVDLLRRNGINCVGWLPLACDPEVHRKHDVPKHLDVCFVGHLSTEPRRRLAQLIRDRFPRSLVGQLFFDDMAQTYSASRAVLNLSVRNDVNMRVFEALSCGSLLLTNDLTHNGLSALLRDGEHLVTYGDLDGLCDKLEYYLGHEAEREAIAASGRREALARHTYFHRMRTLLGELTPRLPPPPPPPPLCPVPVPAIASTTARPLASIIIPAFDQLAYTRQCIDSVRTRTSVPYELILVDNGSTDGTAEYLGSIEGAQVITNTENRGFAAAVNQAIARSLGAHVVLLNNDTVVTTGWLDRMLRAMTSDPSVGLVGPCTNGAPGPQRVEGDYDELNQLEQFAERHARTNAGETARTDLLSGFCLLIHRGVVERIGGLDEAFGIGTFDDYDYCLRAASAGFGAVIAREAYVHHFAAATLNACGVDVAQLLSTNEALFRRRHGYSPTGREAARCERPNPLTSIVVATYNAREYTRQCLDSVRRCTAEPYEVIVVDNGSTDGTIEWLRSATDVRLIENGENRGFPAAANQGIRAARGDQIVLLNNDVVVTPRWLERLGVALRSAPDVGMVGPCSNAVSGSQQVDVDYGDLRDLDQFAAAWAARNQDGAREATRLVGFCLMFRRELTVRIGLLDERFGIGNFEDDDYCYRARLAGFRALIARDCFVHHFGSVTFKASGVDYAALMQTNRTLYEEKWRVQGPQPPATHSLRRDTTDAPPAAISVRSPPQLSLCMIVRDSARTLRPCLESVRAWVDEMVVVDTGSQDDTVLIARELGATVSQFPWCDDFASARNESLVRARGQWLFWMDSDDTIDEPNGRKLRELVRGASSQQATTMGYVLQVRCPGGVAADPYATETIVDHVKVFRNHPGIRFSGRIHEQVLPAIRRIGGAVVWTDIYVRHSGSDTTPEGRVRKQERDLRLLEIELGEQPDDTFTLFNLGMTLLHAGRPGDALNPLCRSLQVAVPGESHVRKLYALLAQAYAELGRRETAIRTCQQGIDAFPGDPELLFRRGILEQSLGRPDEAERSFRSLLEAKADRHFSSMDHGILGIKAWHNMAVIYEQQRRHDLAADAWQRVLAYDRTNRIAWRGLVDALASGHDVAGLERVSALAGASDVPPELPILAQARLLCQRGDPQAATAKLEAAFGQSDSTELLYELSELAFRNDFVDAAERALIELTRRCPNDASASQNLGMLHMRRQDYAGAAEWAKRSLEIRPDHAPAQQLLDHAQDRRDLCEKSMAGE